MTFQSVVGHRRITHLLAGAISRNTLPPTLLFAGPAGVGKWQVAVASAQALNCLAPVHPSPADRLADGTAGPDEGLAVDACGTCRSCERIARGLHVDVLAVTPDEKASIKIDTIRDVLSRTSYRPFEGRRRVVLVREAETLEIASQNALLKSLEEPPPATVFILTTSVPGALLPTVRSRSMMLRFGPLPPAEVAHVLVRDHGHSEAEARALAMLADGSVGQALALGATDVAVLRETALLLLQQSAGRGDAQARLQVAASVVGPPRKERTREELAVIVRLTASMLRDIEAINSGVQARVLANPIVADDLRAIARHFTGNRARDAFGAADRALFALERNAGAKVVAEWLALQI
ncbi:MAG TPA: DNA polymerase III subunit [Vicinamibacterales bacterium]|nr:DNA polymerase III subunit [Vicinamibacterales bacterium]